MSEGRAPAPPTTGPLPSRGRASRFQLEDGDELWRLPAEAEPLAIRLLHLGTRGVGGFVRGSVDDEGPWLVRARGTGGGAWLRADARPWAEGVSVLADVAGAMAACEALSLFPGPLGPDAFAVIDGRGQLVAEPLVAGLVGDVVPSSSAGLSRWIAPEQAAGARWDHAANRYVLGLLLYRVLAGQHAFEGKGLRHGLADRERGAAPPMPDAVKDRLPPGLHGYCLRLLDADVRERPARAEDIRTRLSSFVEETREDGSRTLAVIRDRGARSDALTADRRSRPEAAELAPTERVGTIRSAWHRSLRHAQGLAAIVAAAVLGLVVSFAEIEPAAKGVAVHVPSAAPIEAARTRPDDCASCHPKQTAEWHASVMAHAAKSPLFQALELLIEEQVGKSFACPGGAGILRDADPATACRDRGSGLAITGSGGAGWCVNCHVPELNVAALSGRASGLPAWNGLASVSASRASVRDLVPRATEDGIDCGFCHRVHGPVTLEDERLGRYRGNPEWRSAATGQRFSSRPEATRGGSGIANSGYALAEDELLARASDPDLVPGGAHRRPTDEARAYLQSSAFCGSCHDVRLFGTDALAADGRGFGEIEHFKRLRNAYTEWIAWADDERAGGREPATCQDCHMSAFPGVCSAGLDASGTDRLPTALARACPPGTRFSARGPGARVAGSLASATPSDALGTHYFSGVDVPLSPAFPGAWIDDLGLDAAGIPRGAGPRRDLLLGATFRFAIDGARRERGRLEIPIVIENVGAGHKVPAGFSQEREFWVHLTVRDAADRIVYEVGRVERGDEDLHDKVFLRVNVDDRRTDGEGRPLGLFGADVIDGPDVPAWRRVSATTRVGRGLVNLQNGFLRCVRCIGVVDAVGRCQPGPGQGRHRADRYADGDYELETGACRSNLGDEERLFETYFPVGALDATRGLTKGPDAIIDERSAPPGVPLRFVYELDVGGRPGPLRVEARLLFRAFPPFLLRAFADYEALQAARGQRPGGPLLDRSALERLEVVEIDRIQATLP